MCKRGGGETSARRLRTGVGWGSGLKRGGKGAAWGGRAIARELVNAPSGYPILGLGFQRKRWGQRGSIGAGHACRAFGRGWAESCVCGGGRAAPSDPERPLWSQPAQQSRGPDLAWQSAAGWRPVWVPPGSGWLKAASPLVFHPLLKGDLGTCSGLTAWLNQPGSDQIQTVCSRDLPAASPRIRGSSGEEEIRVGVRRGEK